MAHIDAIVGDLAGVDLVEAVDEVGNGRLACSRGTDESDFLPRFRKQVEIGKHAMSRNIREVDGMESYVTRQRNDATHQHRAILRHCISDLIKVRDIVKVPVGADALALGNPPAPCVMRRLDQLDAAVVHLGLEIHRTEETLGASQRVEQEISQLSELVNGHSSLAHKHQVAGERADIGEALQRKKAAHHRNHGIVSVADHHGDGHHGGGVGLSRRTRLAQFFVKQPELRKVGILVVEDLDDLLPRDHLFHITVQIAQRRLLTVEEELRAPARIAHVQHDGRIARERDDREAPIEHDEQHRGTNHLDSRLDNTRKAVVERLGHRVDIVGEETHDIARARGIEIRKRQRLNVREQIASDVRYHTLRRAHHDLCIAECGQRTRGINRSRKHNLAGKQRQATMGKPVDDRTDHIGTDEVGNSRDTRQHAHHDEADLGMPHVRKQAPKSAFEVLRARPSGRLRHGPRLPSWRYHSKRQRTDLRQIPSDSRKFPGRYGRLP